MSKPYYFELIFGGVAYFSQSLWAIACLRKWITIPFISLTRSFNFLTSWLERTRLWPTSWLFRIVLRSISLTCRNVLVLGVYISSMFHFLIVQLIVERFMQSFVSRNILSVFKRATFSESVIRFIITMSRMNQRILNHPILLKKHLVSQILQPNIVN